MLALIEAARTKWPEISNDVKIRETDSLSITLAVLDNQLVERAWPWMIRRPTFRAHTVILEPIDGCWLGYSDEHDVLFVNFSGERHAN